MALQAYPDVPLFRYPYTELSQAQVLAALAPAAATGPGSKSRFADLAGGILRVVTDGAGTLEWRFGPGQTVTFEGKRSKYGALDLDEVTLLAHVVPDSTKA